MRATKAHLLSKPRNPWRIAVSYLDLDADRPVLLGGVVGASQAPRRDGTVVFRLWPGITAPIADRSMGIRVNPGLSLSLPCRRPLKCRPACGPPAGHGLAMGLAARRFGKRDKIISSRRGDGERCRFRASHGPARTRPAKKGQVALRTLRPLGVAWRRVAWRARLAAGQRPLLAFSLNKPCTCCSCACATLGFICLIGSVVLLYLSLSLSFLPPA